MSATPTPTLEGTQTPSQIEFFWVRYRSLIWTVIVAVMLALVGNYVWGFYEQKQTDQAWSPFTSTLGITATYGDQEKAYESITHSLAGVEMAELEALLAKARDAQKPYLMLTIARKCVLLGDWDRAEATLRQIETTYPNHTIVKSSSHPVQTQKPIKQDPKKPPKRGEDQVDPPVPGSMVSLVRDQIKDAKGYTAPSQFARKPLPEGLRKIKVELSEPYGSFVIALVDETPKHRDAILALVAKEDGAVFQGVAVDEVKRPSRNNPLQPREFHFGFESTKDSDRTKWNTTDPSKNLVDFEPTDLSHFAGAVSARNEADGKSCADRFWIAVDDAPIHDGERVIVGYVVEGLDNLKRVCDATLQAQDEERGMGRPTDNIRVTKVSVLQ